MATPAIESPQRDMAPMLKPGWICLVLGFLTFWIFGFGFILLIAALVMAIISLYAHRASGIFLLFSSIASIVFCGILFFILMFVGGFFFLFHAVSHSMRDRLHDEMHKPSHMVSVSAPRAVTENFYDSYITYAANHSAVADRSGFMQARSSEFTDDFLQAYNEFLKKSQPDYDPILQSNRVPNAVKARTTKIANQTAHVFLHETGSSNDAFQVEVRLKKQAGRWLIDGIGDLNATPKIP